MNICLNILIDSLTVLPRTDISQYMLLILFHHYWSSTLEAIYLGINSQMSSQLSLANKKLKPTNGRSGYWLSRLNHICFYTCQGFQVLMDQYAVSWLVIFCHVSRKSGSRPSHQNIPCTTFHCYILHYCGPLWLQ